MKADIYIATRLAIRARFGTYIFWLVVALSSAVLLGATFSGRHPATIGLDIGLSFIRLSLPFLAALLLQELISREFERKLFLSSLTYPRARAQFLIGRVLAVISLTFTALTVLSLLLAVLTHLISKEYVQSTPLDLGWNYFVTVIFIGLDLLVLLAVGTLLSITASTPSFVLIGTLGFMVAARSFSPIIELLTREPNLVKHSESYHSSLETLGYFLPDLAALDVRMISLYGTWKFFPEDWIARVTSSISYALAIYAFAVFAIQRKKFL